MRKASQPSLAVVFGSGGGIGQALVTALQASDQYTAVTGLSRGSDPAIDLTDEASITRAAIHLSKTAAPIRLVIVATGVLKADDLSPEKSVRELDPERLARSFAINAIGPTLILKHIMPLLPREGRSVFVALSARVGSIGDNHLGGWFGYRASKAALNQLIHTASIELSRSRPEAVCAVLHPGTVATQLSASFLKSGLDIQTPSLAATRLLEVIDGLQPNDSGGFLDQLGRRIPW